MIILNRGTQEEILVTVVDNSDTPLTDLTSLLPKYSTKNPSGGAITTNATALLDSTNKMMMKCFINTTLGGYATDGTYSLYVNFTSGSNTPVLGPVLFVVRA
jgi:hypothetical protein